jgi:hypothetical protein
MPGQWAIKGRWLWLGFKVVYYLLFVLALGVVGHFVWEERSSLDAVWHVPLYVWLIPALIYLGTLGAKGLCFDILARVHGIRVPLIDSVGLTASGLLSNYALPGNVSIPLRTLYLHRVLGLHYRHFLSIALAAFIFSTGLYGAFAGMAALAYGQVPSPTYALVMLVFSGGGLALIVAMLLPYRWLPLVGHGIEQILAGWRMLLRSRSLSINWLGAETLRASLEIVFFYSIVQFLQIELSLAQAAIMVLAKECSMFLRLTPGAFGLSEGVQVFFGVQFGAEAATILVAAIVARIIELVCLTVVSLALVPRLGRRIATAAGEKCADASSRSA